MNKVYAVYAYTPYEGSDILKVFDTEQKAKDYVKSIQNDKKAKLLYDYADYTEWEVE